MERGEARPDPRPGRPLAPRPLRWLRAGKLRLRESSLPPRRKPHREPILRVGLKRRGSILRSGTIRPVETFGLCRLLVPPSQTGNLETSSRAPRSLLPDRRRLPRRRPRVVARSHASLPRLRWKRRSQKSPRDGETMPRRGYPAGVRHPGSPSLPPVPIVRSLLIDPRARANLASPRATRQDNVTPMIGVGTAHPESRGGAFRICRASPCRTASRAARTVGPPFPVFRQPRRICLPAVATAMAPPINRGIASRIFPVSAQAPAITSANQVPTVFRDFPATENATPDRTAGPA